MKKKISLEEVSKHSLILVMGKPFDIDNPIQILFDNKNIAIAHFIQENKILFLETINLEVFGLQRIGIGKIAVDYLGEYFSQFIENNEQLLFLIQYESKNTSKEFYKKIGFKDFEKSKQFSRKEKNNIYFILDSFCSDAQILYKFVRFPF
jgi:ABC-type sugar transport system ATPase subunit